MNDICANIGIIIFNTENIFAQIAFIINIKKKPYICVSLRIGNPRPILGKGGGFCRLNFQKNHRMSLFTLIHWNKNVLNIVLKNYQIYKKINTPPLQILFIVLLALKLILIFNYMQQLMDGLLCPFQGMFQGCIGPFVLNSLRQFVVFVDF